MVPPFPAPSPRRSQGGEQPYLPTDPPAALTPAFADDETKVRQWRAFVRRDEISGVSVSLAEITAAIELFLMPPTRALVTGQAFGFHWLPGGPWQ